MIENEDLLEERTRSYVKIFLIENEDLLEGYSNICNKVSTDIKKEFDSEPVSNKNFDKTKIQSYRDEATYFYNKEINEVDSNRTCLAVISLDSAV